MWMINLSLLPDAALTQKLTVIAKNVAATAGLTVHEGKVWSTDAILRETKEIVNGVIDQGAIGVDMVSAPFLTIAQVYKIPAVSILAVSDNLITGQMGFINPDYYMAEGMLIQMALELVKQLDASKMDSRFCGNDNNLCLSHLYSGRHTSKRMFYMFSMRP